MGEENNLPVGPTKTTKISIKRDRAIELWRQTKGHISNICSAVGIARSTFYDWMKDPGFVQKIIDAEAELNDDVRDALIQKIAEGDMTAIIFYLKSRHPDLKQDRGGSVVAVQVNNKIELDRYLK